MKHAYINARLIDAESKLDVIGGLIVENDKILDLGEHITKKNIGNIPFTDCEKNIICAGLVDMRVVINDEYKENLGTVAQSALAGGVVHLAYMSESKTLNLASLQKKNSEMNSVKIHGLCSLTQNRNGKDLNEIGLLTQQGAVGFSDGLNPVQDSKTLLQALTYSRLCNALIVQHPHDKYLGDGGQMNKGVLSSRLGLAGIPPEAEVIMLERDLRLVEMTGARYHAANISTAQSVEVIKRAKDKGLNITCDTAPFYFSLSENDVTEYRTFAKLMPPLRSDNDREAVAEAVKDGTIDIITSDHRPADQDSKRLPFAQASVGAVGLETLLSLSLA